MPELIVVVNDILMGKVSIGNVPFQSIPLTVCLILIIVDADVHISRQLQIFIVSPVIPTTTPTASSSSGCFINTLDQ